MTLDEVIEYFETEVKRSNSLVMPYEARKKYSDDCKQMAEWLKELKFYREIKNSWNKMFPNGEEINADEDSN